MKPRLYVTGSQKLVGKTTIALGIIHYLQSLQINACGWKPIDVGQLEYNAQDTLSDGEKFQQLAHSFVQVNLVNPYLLNENLPPVLASQRDGLRIDSHTLHHYLQKLETIHDFILIEGATGISMPQTQTDTSFTFIQKWKSPVLWISGTTELDLAITLTSLTLLRQNDLEIVGVILNNVDEEQNTDLLRYHWITIEEQTDCRVFGLLPKIKFKDPIPQEISLHLQQHFEDLFWQKIKDLGKRTV